MNKLIFLESTVAMPLMGLPVRSTYVQFERGGALISPGSCLAKEQLESLKAVSDLVAPSLFHCAGMKRATEVFASARKWGVSGAKLSKPEIGWTDELSAKTWPHSDELPLVQLQGLPKANEVVFFHKDSKSLIVADLCFNILNAKGFGPWFILNLFGTHNRFATSRFFASFIKDKRAFERSIIEIFNFNFENIVVSHGTNVYGGAKDKLRLALAERGFKID